MQGPWALHPRDIEPTIKMKPLPRYVERNRNGLSFCVGGGARIPLPNDPTSPEFRAAYNAALVGAIAAEGDGDE